MLILGALRKIRENYFLKSHEYQELQKMRIFMSSAFYQMHNPTFKSQIDSKPYLYIEGSGHNPPNRLGLLLKV